MKNEYYRLWVVDQNCNEYTVAERITKKELEEWLNEWAENHPSAFHGDVWWVDHSSTCRIKDDIPYNSMGYIAKFEKID